MLLALNWCLWQVCFRSLGYGLALACHCIHKRAPPISGYTVLNVLHFCFHVNYSSVSSLGAKPSVAHVVYQEK